MNGIRRETMRHVIGLAQINNSFSGAHYLPYAAGLMQAYAQAHLPDPGRFTFLDPLYRRLPVDAALEKLAGAHVVGMSLYVWNQRLSLAICEALKARDPDVLVILGGPQVPDRAEDFLRAHPFVDVAVHGEGEPVFARLLERLPSRDWSGIDGMSHLDSAGRFVTRPATGRLSDLDVVPSPYLTGVFDSLMARERDGEWLALWETNRGCPFQCTFCDWGSATQAKINRFGMTRLEREMAWFAEHRIEFVFCCDANFGILKRDVDLARMAAEVKARAGYPRALSVQNTKNATDRAYETQKILSDAGLNKGVTLSMQSLDAATLDSIKRRNISLDTYDELQRRFLDDGVVTYSDLILGLPGETYDSFADGASALIANGQHNRIQFNNLSVLPNAEMGDPDYRRAHGIQTVQTEIVNMHGSLGDADSGITERQELVIATRTMPPADWRRARAFGWMCALLHFDKLMQIPFTVVHAATGIPYRDLVELFLDADGDRFPVVAGIAEFFFRRAAEIQDGGFEHHHSPRWLDVFWPDDEFVYITLSTEGRLDAFYQEAQGLLTGLLDEHGMSATTAALGDALTLNRALLKQPGMTGPREIELDHNVLDVWRGALAGQSIEIAARPESLRVDRAGQAWDDWPTWCREVVWFGNKKGAYLYGSEALTKYYAGHS